jgi:hypothetical protein
LIETRRMILERAGFETLTALQLVDAAQIMKERSVDLLIGCSSIDKQDVPHVLKTVRSIRPHLKDACRQQ